MRLKSGMMWMAAGVGATLLYDKYNKDIMKKMNKGYKQVKKSASKAIEDIKEN